MNKLSRNLLVTAIALGTSLVSVSSMAAAKDGNLNFNFQGVIPAKAVTPADWSFVTTSGATYNPTSIALSAVSQADGSYNLETLSPEVFAIKVTSGAFTASSKIQATLSSSSVSGTGLLGDTSTLAPTVKINGVSLSSTAADVATPASGATQVPMTLTSALVVPVANVNPTGGNVSSTTAVIFSADVTA
ncbi:hypothetical protein [Photobacterium kishitanii]|uniref:Uncharacterized protein n=1 Tax=Photobacterium kishitanii TaxID=318456 RepID=A0A2T3K9X4_9GAMM|nr:hypothetical protein [Photobacterium kishitanii]PSU87486.1 hypothetical protein C9J27_26100 [Photobacterium kishitanii]